MMLRILILIFSVVVLFLLVCEGGADLAFNRAVEEKDLNSLKVAQVLNPFVSDYFYEEYRQTHDLAALRRAISLEPVKPAYHMYYGLALLDLAKRTRLSDEEAVGEICKAAGLKPYSAQYRETCIKFRSTILGQ